MYKRFQVFAAACTGLFIFGMTLVTLGSILPGLQSKYGVDEISTAMLAAILPLGIMGGSLVFGPIVDRYGYKLLLILSVLVSALALGGLALTNSATILYLCIFLIGFAGGIINGGTSALVADISAENKGANLSLLGVSFGAGALGMPLLLGVLSKQFDYTTILAAVSGFMLIPVVFYFFVRFPAPKQTQGFPLKEGIKLVKEKALLACAFFLFFQSGVESLINNWTTSFLQFKLEVSNEKALYALSFSLVGLTLTRLMLGGLLKKISSLLVMIISLLVMAAGNLVLMYTNTYEMAFAALIITGAGLAAGFPVILGYVGQLYAHLSGTAFSIALVIALIGNTIINYAFGYISSTYSINYLPIAMLICIGCMLVMMFVIKKQVSPKIKL